MPLEKEKSDRGLLRTVFNKRFPINVKYYTYTYIYAYCLIIGRHPTIPIESDYSY